MKTLLTAFAIAAALTGTAAAQYPNKPVRFVVATGAGGSDDFTARQVAAKLSEILGQQFLVENRPGAGQGRQYQAAVVLRVLPQPDRLRHTSVSLAMPISVRGWRTGDQ